MWKKHVPSPAQLSFRGVSFPKNRGIRGIYEKPSLQPKKNIASIGLAKGYLHPLTSYKSPGFHKQRFFSVKKNHRQRSAFGSHGPFFFCRFFVSILSPNLRHWCIHTSLLCISFQQLLIDRTATSRHHLTSIFVFGFSSDIAPQSVPPL